jgi:hypothetical protein
VSSFHHARRAADYNGKQRCFRSVEWNEIEFRGAANLWSAINSQYPEPPSPQLQRANGCRENGFDQFLAKDPNVGCGSARPVVQCPDDFLSARSMCELRAELIEWHQSRGAGFPICPGSKIHATRGVLFSTWLRAGGQPAAPGDPEIFRSHPR